MVAYSVCAWKRSRRKREFASDFFPYYVLEAARSALVIWNAWKRSRSVGGLVLRAVKTRRQDEKRKILTRTFESDPNKLGADGHVDFQDWDRGR